MSTFQKNICQHCCNKMCQPCEQYMPTFWKIYVNIPLKIHFNIFVKTHDNNCKKDISRFTDQRVRLPRRNEVAAALVWFQKFRFVDRIQIRQVWYPDYSCLYDCACAETTGRCY